MSRINQTRISKWIVLALIGVMFYIFILSLQREKEEEVVTEIHACVTSVCYELEGAGLACSIQKPRITKITISRFEGAVTYRFTPTTDRCADGSD